MSFDWPDCMVRFEVSTHTLFTWLEKHKKEFEFESKLVPSLIAFYFHKCSRWYTVEYKEKSIVKIRDVTVPDHGRAPYMCRHHPRPKAVTPSTTQAPSPSPWQSWPHTVLEPTTLSSSMSLWCCAPRTIPETMTPSSLWHSRAGYVVVLPEHVTTSQSPRCYRPHTFPEPSMLSSAPSPQCYIVYFLCHFWPTNPEFDVLHCHIAFICYIAFVLLHCFDMLYCHITLIWYIAFVLMYCFDMLNCHIALICYKLLHCFCSATFWSIWMHTTLLNDESGLSETCVATWTNIIVLWRF
jgi:hypothetical protein